MPIGQSKWNEGWISRSEPRLLAGMSIWGYPLRTQVEISPTSHVSAGRGNWPKAAVGGLFARVAKGPYLIKEQISAQSRESMTEFEFQRSAS